MNRAVRGLGWAARAIVLAGVAVAHPFPALAGPIDEGLPPLQYDIGGETEADVIVNMIDRLGETAPPLIRVKIGEALAECDKIQMQRYSEHYVYAGVLYGCLIRDYSFANPVIVYTVDPADPTFAARLLRHEIGHHLGWPGDHSR